MSSTRVMSPAAWVAVIAAALVVQGTFYGSMVAALLR